MAQDEKLGSITATGTALGTDKIAVSKSGVTYSMLLSVVLAYIKTALETTFLGAATIVTTGTVTDGTWNARITKRYKDHASNANITVDCDLFDSVNVSTLSTNTTINNPTGTPTGFQELDYRITSDATPRTFTFDTDFNFSTDLAAPLNTTSSKTIIIRFVYNRNTTKWDCILILDNL